MKLKTHLLLLPLVALGVTAACNLTDAQAKSRVKVTSNRYLTEIHGTKRNVVPTGKNALYNIAGTLRGAKKKATVTTMKKLRSAKSSAKYFRIYKMATTSRKSVYYKVFSFDQKYRGWIYGGKTKKVFAGGVKRASTTMSIATPEGAGIGGATYHYNVGQSVWNYPKNAQYKAKRILNNTTNYQDDELRVTNAVMMTREQTGYFYVRNLTHPQLSGWVKTSGVTRVEKPTETTPPVTPTPDPTPTPTPTPDPTPTPTPDPPKPTPTPDPSYVDFKTTVHIVRRSNQTDFDKTPVGKPVVTFKATGSETNDEEAFTASIFKSMAESVEEYNKTISNEDMKIVIGATDNNSQQVQDMQKNYDNVKALAKLAKDNHFLGKSEITLYVWAPDDWGEIITPPTPNP
ncbi:hypothetical protein [Lentilactobacillus curieae]|uniref:hypothetical protein n=1 Tax=Lentilactobacillus curieae TaxID=1138822 RepID=UPI00068CD3A5|nr:hypothetical protein [Lentilactobacillus curieae]